MKRSLVLMFFGGLLAATMLFSPPAKADANDFIYALEHDSTTYFYGTKGQMLDLGYRVCADLMAGWSPSTIISNVYYNRYYDFQTTRAATEFVILAQDHLC